LISLFAIHFALRPPTERLINPHAFPERTVMKMPSEYFTCPFNTSRDDAKGGKSENEGGRSEGKAVVQSMLGRR